VLNSAGSALLLVTLPSANKSNPNVIDGRAIFTLAHTALKLSLEQSVYADGELPSVYPKDDLDEHILNGMGSMVGKFKAKASVDVDVDGDIDAVVKAKAIQYPEGWIFPGLMAYPLLGPCAHVDVQSQVFDIDPLGACKKNIVIIAQVEK
jgi:hypothetical protein